MVDTLVTKCMRGLDATGLQVLLIAGGVSPNDALRSALTAACEARGDPACRFELRW